MARKKQLRTVAECDNCPALCCKDLSMLIGKPRTKSEIEDLKWQLYFATVRVYIRSRRWYLLIKGRCMYLDENNLCTIYDHRPSRCRRHNPPDCERFGGFYDTLLSTPEELEEYLERTDRAK